jgi:hypothetical protein
MISLPAFDARQLATRLLSPKILDSGLSSGVFVQARSSEESSQFIYELATMLQAEGLGVSITDWEQLMAEDGFEQFVRALHTQFLGGCKKRSSDGASTLADVLQEITRQRPRSIALLLNGFRAPPVKPTDRILKALKAARDRVNLDPNSTGRVLLVTTCVPPVTPSMYVEGQEQAFYGAVVGSLVVANP